MSSIIELWDPEQNKYILFDTKTQKETTKKKPKKKPKKQAAKSKKKTKKEKKKCTDKTKTLKVHSGVGGRCYIVVMGKRVYLSKTKSHNKKLSFKKRKSGDPRSVEY